MTPREQLVEATAAKLYDGSREVFDPPWDRLANHYRTPWLTDALRALAAIETLGIVLVPREATEDMLHGVMYLNIADEMTVRDIYGELLAASPYNAPEPAP